MLKKIQDINLRQAPQSFMIYILVVPPIMKQTWMFNLNFLFDPKPGIKKIHYILPFCRCQK